MKISNSDSYGKLEASNRTKYANIKAVIAINKSIKKMSQRGVLLFGSSTFTIQRYNIGLHYDNIDEKDTFLVGNI